MGEWKGWRGWGSVEGCSLVVEGLPSMNEAWTPSPTPPALPTSTLKKRERERKTERGKKERERKIDSQSILISKLP